MSRDGKTKKYRIGYDILPKILCFVAAFILWMYVTQVETSDYEETFNGVTIELVNTSILESNAGLHVYNGYGNTASVTVRGRKSDINRYSSENIRLFADVSDIAEAGRHAVQISTETPNGLTVSKMSVPFINVYVDKASTKEIDIRPKITTAVIGNGCELGEATPEYSLVTVTGPKTVLNNVDHAQVSLELGNIQSTVSTIAPLELIGRNGDAIDMRYVQLTQNEIKVTVPVYTTKEIPLRVDFKYGYYNDSNVKITYEPKTVTVKGDPTELEKLSSISLGTLDEKTTPIDVMRVFPFSLPEGLTTAQRIEGVNVTVTHIGTSLRTYEVNNIKIDGADKMNCELITKTLTVRVRGTKAELDKIKKEDIKATVNLSEYGDSVTGTVQAYPTVSLGKNAGNAYAVDNYEILIKIS